MNCSPTDWSITFINIFDIFFDRWGQFLVFLIIYIFHDFFRFYSLELSQLLQHFDSRLNFNNLLVFYLNAVRNCKIANLNEMNLYECFFDSISTNTSYLWIFSPQTSWGTPPHREDSKMSRKSHPRWHHFKKVDVKSLKALKAQYSYCHKIILTCD